MRSVRRRIRFRPWIAAALLAVGSALAAPASSAPAFAQAAAPPFSDAKLEAFVSAALKVNALVEQWRPKIEAASPDQQPQLKQTANAELMNAIQSTPDMSPQEYQQIAQTAQADPALQQRILGVLHARGGQPAQ